MRRLITSLAVIAVLVSAVTAGATPAKANPCGKPNIVCVGIAGGQAGVLSPYLYITVKLRSLLKLPTRPQSIRLALRGCAGEQDRLQLVAADRKLVRDAAGQLVWNSRLPAAATNVLHATIVIPKKGGTTFCVRLHAFSKVWKDPVDIQQQFQVSR